LDGYASYIIQRLREYGPVTQPTVHFAAILPPPTQLQDPRLAQLGVPVAESLDALLARPDLDAVWLPVPIHLHRPFTERALAAGKAVLCEKPITGSLQDADALIRARDNAGCPVAVAYQSIYDPLVVQLKRKLLDGVLGTISSMTLYGCWPRSSRYYRRSDWPGKLRIGSTWVLDSPAHNALAHFIHLGLFLLGNAPDRPALPRHVEAELYRANPIENYDTITLRTQLDSGPVFHVALTHACRETHEPVLTLHGTKGTLTWSYQGVQLNSMPLRHSPALYRDLIERFARLARGIPDPTRFSGTLEAARAEVLLINAVSEAAAIVPVAPSFIREHESNGEHFRIIPGIEAALKNCLAQRQLLHETGAFPFTQPAGRLDTTGYREFHGPRQG
jgi:predicted dehydrogenase